MSFDWHRAFGLLFKDQLTGTPFDVEIDKDVSVQQQLLDVLVIRRRPGVMTEPLPDGFAPLAEHNLITFKSLRQPLDGWAMDELLGYYTAYRKLASPDLNNLLPEDDFRLYAVATRRPEGLAKHFELKSVGVGVYDCLWGSRTVRLLVVRELPRVEPNAGLALFSADPKQVEYGRSAYRRKNPEMSALLGQLANAYYEEEGFMPYGFQEYMQEVKQELKQELKQEFLAALTDEERLAGVPEEKRLEGIPVEKRIAGLSGEEKERLLKLLQASDSDEPLEGEL